MAEPVNIAAKTKSRPKKKFPDDPSGLPHEIDSAGRTRAATRILVNLPKSSASAPANLNETSTSAEFPALGDTRAVTADGAPLPVPFSYDVSENGDGLPALQTVSGSSLSGVEPESSDADNMVVHTCWPTLLDAPPLSRPNSEKGEYTTS
ncbi:hypothetical protein B0H14DRAFT_2596743 [Mycena olivaceomarginata]|nr:hypothetical protein B0H14DRAFT_2596743 [Mycena olivaceomarginata]